MTDKSTHQLRSGDRIEVMHGAESLVLAVCHREGGGGSAHLTAAEAMSLGTALYVRGFGLMANVVGQALAEACGRDMTVDLDLREDLEIEVTNGQDQA